MIVHGNAASPFDAPPLSPAGTIAEVVDAARAHQK
jgi:hypothetical protein